MPASLFTPASAALAKALTGMRKNAGMTQRQLAKILGREQNYVARVELMNRRVDLIELTQWVRACGLDAKVEVPKLFFDIAPLIPLKQ